MTFTIKYESYSKDDKLAYRGTVEIKADNDLSAKVKLDKHLEKLPNHFKLVVISCKRDDLDFLSDIFGFNKK